MATVWVDFSLCKQLPMPRILQALGILEKFKVRDGRLSGACPLPTHPHPLGVGRHNKSQFSANYRPDLGRWLATCWGDCGRSFDMVGFVMAYLGVDASHCRLWFAERFPEVVTKKPRDASPRRDAATVVSAPVKADVSKDQDADGKAQGKETQQTNETAATPDQGPRAAAVPNSPSTVATAPEPLKAYKPIRFYLDLDLSAALPYLASRGISAETAKHFGLGIAGVKSKTFCGYVCSPIWTNPPTEFPLGYIGRWPGEPPEGKSRYLLPKNFPSDAVVFNLHGALSEGSGPLIVVESIFSVFWLHQMGYRTAVAIFGSALGDGQAKAILDSGRSVVVLLDPDLSGRRGAADAVEKLKRGFVRDVVLDEETEVDRLNAEQLRHYLPFLPTPNPE